MTEGRSRVIWSLLVGALVVATVGMVAAATWLSFLAFKSLAELVGWSPDTAWAVQPVVELFVLAGAAELAMRTWERRSDRSLPEVLMYAALVVSIAVNVSSHVLANVSAQRLWWHTVVIGVMAAMVPLAQLGGVYLLADRLRALGGGAPAALGGTDRGTSRGESDPLAGNTSQTGESEPAELALANGNGHGVTLRAQAEREALRYLEENGVLPSENVLAGLARCSRGTARNALAPLRKG